MAGTTFYKLVQNPIQVADPWVTIFTPQTIFHELRYTHMSKL